MDKASLENLSSIADLVHDKNAAELSAAKASLEGAKEKRRALLMRPGRDLSDLGHESSALLAQTKWSNSVEAELPVLDQEIQDLENEVARHIAQTRQSFTKVKGLEALVEKRSSDEKSEALKQEEQTQDMLVGLRRISNIRSE